MDSRSSSIPGKYILPCENGERHQAYKELITEIADSLKPIHVVKLAYLYELSDEMKQRSPLQILEYLHQKKDLEFSEWNVEALTTLLENINEEQLIGTVVDPYKRKFCVEGERVASCNFMPGGAMNQRIPLEKRPSSCFSAQTSKDMDPTSIVCPSYQETASLSRGDSPSFPIHASDYTDTNQPSSTQFAGSNSLSQLGSSSMHFQHPDTEEHTRYTVKRVTKKHSKSSQGIDQIMVHDSPHSHLNFVQPKSVDSGISNTANHAAKSLSQRNAHNGYNNMRSHSVSLLETQQPRDDQLTQQQGPARPSLLRPQSISLCNASVGLKKEVIQPEPLIHDTALNHNSSADSVLGHHKSHSSGFVSSGEVMHHPARKPYLPSKSQYSFSDSKSNIGDGHASQEFSQGSLHQYPAYMPSTVESKSPDHNSDDQQSAACIQSSVRSTDPFSSEHQSAYSSSPLFNTSAYSRTVYSGMRHHSSQRERDNPFSLGETLYHSQVRPALLTSEETPLYKLQKQTRRNSTTLQEQNSQGKDPKHAFKLDWPLSVRSPQTRGIGEPTNVSGNNPQDVTKPVSRHRSFSLDRNQVKAKQRTHRLSLHSDRSSSTTLSRSLSNAHTARWSRESQFYSPSFEMARSSSKDTTLPTKKSESTIQRSGCTDTSLGANKTPKPYHQPLLSRTKAIKPEQELEWKLKMNDINKLIYHPKHIGKYLPCPWKIAVEGKDGLKIVLQLRLHPFGVEEDKNRNITIEGVIEQPKKCRLHSKAKMSIHVSAVSEKKKIPLCKDRVERRDANLSYFYIKGFISHERLKESIQYSANESVIVTVKSEMILPA